MKHSIIFLFLLIVNVANAQLRSSNNPQYINSVKFGLQSVVTAAGTTTLTVTSPYETIFTGSTTQTIVLPDATTLALGQHYHISNQSTGIITIQTNGGATLWTLAASTDAELTTTDISTSAGTWEIDYYSAVSSTGKKLTNTNSITLTGTDAATYTFPNANATTENPKYAVYGLLGSPIVAETVDQPLSYANTATALVDNTVRFVAIYLQKAKTLTGIKVYVRTQGVYTGDNNNRVGLYTYSGGTLTLVASSTNSATLWTNAANAVQTINFSSTYAAQPGIYYVGLLYNQSAQTTAPALGGGVALNNLAQSNIDFSNSAKLYGTLAAQNDLPSSQAMSGVTGVTASYWVALF